MFQFLFYLENKFQCINIMSDTTSNKSDNFPKSINGRQCIGPCYYPFTNATHPSTGEQFTHRSNFCPVERYTRINNDGKVIIEYIDECLVPTSRGVDDEAEIEAKILSLNIPFDSKYFVNLYYNIISLDGALEWFTDNGHLAFRTKERLMNNALVAFNEQINPTDERLTDYISLLFKKNIRKIYKYLSEYFSVDGTNIIITPLNKQETNQPIENQSDKQNLIKKYISKKWFNAGKIQKFIYIIGPTKIFSTSTNITKRIIKFFSTYMEKKINSS
jgi:hypothetical protein